MSRVQFRSLSYLILILLFTSCLGSKKITEKTSKETSTLQTDSISKETVNKGISDSATFKVAESNTGDIDFDKRVNEAVSNVLKSINFQKSSGDNSYKFYYDEQLRELRAKIELGETRNSEVKVDKDAVVETKETESVEKYLKVVPWWLYVILLVLFWPNILKVISPIGSFINSRILNPKK